MPPPEEDEDEQHQQQVVEPLLGQRRGSAARSSRYLPSLQLLSQKVCCAQSTWVTTTSEIKEALRSAAAAKLLFMSRLHVEVPYLRMTPLSALCSACVAAAWLWLVVSVVAGTVQVRGKASSGERALLGVGGTDRLLLEPTTTAAPPSELLVPTTAGAVVGSSITVAMGVTDAQGQWLEPIPWPLYYRPPQPKHNGTEADQGQQGGGERTGEDGKGGRFQRALWLIFSYEYERRFALRIIYFSVAFMGATALMWESYRWSLSALSQVCCMEVQSELRMSVRNVVESDFRDFLMVYKKLFVISPSLTLNTLRTTLLILRHNFDTVCNINCDYKLDPDDFKPLEWKNSRTLGLFDELSVLISVYCRKQWGAVEFNCWDLFRRGVSMLTRGNRGSDSSRGALVLYKRSQNLLRAQVKQQRRRVMQRWRKKKFFTDDADISQFSIPPDQLAGATTEAILAQVDKGMFLRHIGVREFMQCRAKRKRERRFRALFLWTTLPIVVFLWGCFIVSLVLAHVSGSRTDGAGAEVFSAEFLPEWGAIIAATLGSVYVVLLGFEDLRMRLVESLLAANVEAIVEYANIGISMLWSISVEETLVNYVMALTEEAQSASDVSDFIVGKVKEVEMENRLRNIVPPPTTKPHQKKKGFVVVDDNEQRFEHSMISASKHSVEFVYLPTGVQPGAAENLQKFMEMQKAQLMATSRAPDTSWSRPIRSKYHPVVFNPEYANDMIGLLGSKFANIFKGSGSSGGLSETASGVSSTGAFVAGWPFSAASKPSPPSPHSPGASSKGDSSQQPTSPGRSSGGIFGKCSSRGRTGPDAEDDDDEPSDDGDEALIVPVQPSPNDAPSAKPVDAMYGPPSEQTSSAPSSKVYSRIIDPREMDQEACNDAANAIAKDSGHLVTSERASLEQLFEALQQTERPAKWGDIMTPGRD